MNTKHLQDIIDDNIDSNSNNFVIAAGNKINGNLQVHCQLSPDLIEPVRRAINLSIDNLIMEISNG